MLVAPGQKDVDPRLHVGFRFQRGLELDQGLAGFLPLVRVGLLMGFEKREIVRPEIKSSKFVDLCLQIGFGFLLRGSLLDQQVRQHPVKTHVIGQEFQALVESGNRLVNQA